MINVVLKLVHIQKNMDILQKCAASHKLLCGQMSSLKINSDFLFIFIDEYARFLFRCWSWFFSMSLRHVIPDSVMLQSFLYAEEKFSCQTFEAFLKLYCHRLSYFNWSPLGLGDSNFFLEIKMAVIFGLLLSVYK